VGPAPAAPGRRIGRAAATYPDAVVPTPRLRTARLELGPLRVDDAGEMVAVLADPRLYAFTGGEPPDLATLRHTYGRLVRGASDDGREAWHNWIVRLAEGGPPVGTVQATVWADRPRAEIAWVIGVEWQGRGYATEAARALIGWLEGAGILTVEALVQPDHAASGGVARGAGLQPTDELVDGERVWRRVSPG
jgi:RimJ/RimL family protein N-acetyltransferase